MKKRNEEIKVAGRPAIGPNYARRWDKKTAEAKRAYELDRRMKEEYLRRSYTGEQYA